MIISKVAAATASAVVVVGTHLAVGAIDRISSADAAGDEVLAYAYLGGSVGPYRYFGPNEKNYNYDIAALDVKVAEINGDAQYETCWNLGEGALSIDYLALAVVKGENDSVPQRDNQTYLNPPYFRHFSDLTNIFWYLSGLYQENYPSRFVGADFLLLRKFQRNKVSDFGFCAF